MIEWENGGSPSPGTAFALTVVIELIVEALALADHSYGAQASNGLGIAGRAAAIRNPLGHLVGVEVHDPGHVDDMGPADLAVDGELFRSARSRSDCTSSSGLRLRKKLSIEGLHFPISIGPIPTPRKRTREVYNLSTEFYGFSAGRLRARMPLSRLI